MRSAQQSFLLEHGSSITSESPRQLASLVYHIVFLTLAAINLSLVEPSLTPLDNPVAYPQLATLYRNWYLKPTPSSFSSIPGFRDNSTTNDPIDLILASLEPHHRGLHN